MENNLGSVKHDKMLWQTHIFKMIKVGFKLSLCLMILFFLGKKEMDLRLDLNTTDIIPRAAEELSIGSALSGFLASAETIPAKTVYGEVQEIPLNISTLAAQPQDNRGNTYSNMTYQAAKSVPVQQSKQRRQGAYVKRFAQVARSEMKRYGIPASITLAQGLIESNAGDSRLSRENNNHFGMKCFSKTCSKNHCSNFTDDSHKDFFRKYTNAWESFRAHSLMLQGKRYRHLKKEGNDYKKWSHGLKKAGYATDPRYAEKLIHIIKELKLDQFDQ